MSLFMEIESATLISQQRARIVYHPSTQGPMLCLSLGQLVVSLSLVK